MLKLKCLGSSSKGNCHLLTDGSTTIMLDCGKLYSNIKEHLIGNKIDAVLITHEHGDHVGGVKSLLENKDTHIYSSVGTTEAMLNKKMIKLYQAMPIVELKTYRIGSFEIAGFKVMHNAAEPFNYLIKHKSGATIAYITDTGYIKNINLHNLDYLLIECNFDEAWYEEGKLLTSQQEMKKYRLLGNYGHLSVQQCIEFINKTKDLNLKKVILCHISGDNPDYKTFEERVKKETGVESITALDPKKIQPQEIYLTDNEEMPKFE